MIPPCWQKKLSRIIAESVRTRKKHKKELEDFGFPHQTATKRNPRNAESCLLTPNGAWALAVFDNVDRCSSLDGIVVSKDAHALSMSYFYK